MNASSMSDALLFWLLAAAMAALAVVFALPGLLARRAPPARGRRTEMNAAIYRGELADLARERAEGRLTEPQYARAREEIERRLLSDVAGEGADPPGAASPRASALVMAIALPLAAFCLYAVFGNPDALEAWPAATALRSGSQGSLPAGRDELVRHLARNARDGRGWVLLARMDFETDRFADAAASYEKALAASPKIAADAGIWCEYADALGMAQGGALAGRPRELIMRALSLDPAHPKALEMAGSAAYERRDFRMAATYWKDLLAHMTPGTPAYAELATAIERAERRAALSLPPTASAAPGG